MLVVHFWCGTIERRKGKNSSAFFAKKGAKRCLAPFGCAFSVTPDHKKVDFAPFATSPFCFIPERNEKNQQLKLVEM